MPFNILVLGKSGMAGHLANKYMSGIHDFHVYATHLEKNEKDFYFDALGDINVLETIIDRIGKIDFVINCIGITIANIDESNAQSKNVASNINSEFPLKLGQLADKKGFKVIHISTDGVFKGDKDEYFEDTPADCIDFYGITKLNGESSSPNVINIRCSIIGPSPFEKKGLYEWFCSQPDGTVINGYVDSIWKGATTLQFAELCESIIKQGSFDNLRKQSHIFHFAPNKELSKFELLEFLKKLTKKDNEIKPSESANNQVKRILKTRFDSFKTLYTEFDSIEEPLKRLIKFSDIFIEEKKWQN